MIHVEEDIYIFFNYYWQVSAYILSTKFHLNLVSSVGRRTVWRDVYMTYSFVCVVQIMHQRNYRAGDFVRIQQTAATDVCATSDMLHRLYL